MSPVACRYIDSHTHVHFAAFADDYRDAMARARAAGVGMVLVGTQKDTSRRGVEVAHEFPDIAWAAIGLHPIHTEASYHDPKELEAGAAAYGEHAKSFMSRGEVFDPAVYRPLAEDPKTVAIGECGLDYYREQATGLPERPFGRAGDKRPAFAEATAGRQATRDRQKAAFVAQIELAAAVGKPLMIHCRNAFADLIDILVACRLSLVAGRPGVIHFFTGTPDDARKLLDLGFSFTFGGVVTFTRDYDEAIKLIPPDRILSETDAPYVAPVPHRGKRNEPAYVVEVVKKLAEIKGLTAEEMAARTVENARRVFGIL